MIDVLAGLKFVEFVKKVGRDEPRGASLRSYGNRMSIMKRYACFSTYFFHRLQNAVESPFAGTIQEHAQQKGLVHRARAVRKSSRGHDEQSREIVVESELQPRDHRQAEQGEADKAVPPKVRQQPPRLTHVIRLYEHNGKDDEGNDEDGGECAGSLGDVRRDESVDWDTGRDIVEQYSSPECREVPYGAFNRHALQGRHSKPPCDSPQRVADEQAREEGPKGGGEWGWNVSGVRE